MNPLRMLLAGTVISLVQPAAAAPGLPTLTITNVRPDRPGFEPAAMVADARLSNATATSFWFTGISGPEDPQRHVSVDRRPSRGTHVCLTGARAYELPPGAAIVFPVHGHEHSFVTPGVPLGGPRDPPASGRSPVRRHASSEAPLTVS